MSRQFSEAARKASLDARRVRSETLATEFGKPAVFVVRISTDLFGWEVRQYGGVVLTRSKGGFLSGDLARQAGEAALSMNNGSPGPGHSGFDHATGRRTSSAEHAPGGAE